MHTGLATKLTRPFASRFLHLGYLTERVYINNPQNLEDLKHNIRQEIDTISQEVLSSVMKAVVKRTQLVSVAGSRHLKRVSFHT